MKSLIDYITESEKLPTYYFGNKGEKLVNMDGKIRFVYTENLDNDYSEHKPIKHGNSLIFETDKMYIVVMPQHSKMEIHEIIKQVFHGAKKIDSEKAQIEAGFPHRGLVGDQPKVNIKVEVYEINPEDANWIKFNKMSTNLWISPDPAPYSIVSIDRPFVWNKFK